MSYDTRLTLSLTTDELCAFRIVPVDHPLVVVPAHAGGGSATSDTLATKIE